MHLPWAVEALPVLLHSSLFLFFVGLVTFLLCVNECVYLSVIWWVGLFSMLYVCITFMPMFWPDSPYYTPLSKPVSFVSAHALSAIFKVIRVSSHPSLTAGDIYSDLRRHFNVAWISCTGPKDYRKLRDRLPSEVKEKWLTPVKDHLGKLISHAIGVLTYQANLIMMGSSRKAAETITSERSSEIDLDILRWTIGALGEDDGLEFFFGAIPGFFKSQMVKGLKGNLTDAFRSKFAESWGGFLARSLSSNSVGEKDKDRRVDICMNAMKEICDDNNLPKMFCELSSLRFDQTTPSIRTARILAARYSNTEIPTTRTSELARYTLAKILPYVRERDRGWIALASGVYGLSEQKLQYHIDQGDDSVLLAIFNHAARQVIDAEPSKWEMPSSISKFDIKKTRSSLQIEFCALWNEIVEKANNESVGSGGNPVLILRGIRHLYIDLHQGTDAAPTYFDVSTDDLGVAPFWFDPSSPSSYRLCQVESHRPGSIVPSPIQHHHHHHTTPLRSCSEGEPTHGGHTAAQHAEEENFTSGPTSSAHAPPHSRGFLSLFPNPVPNLRANVVASHSPTHNIIGVVSRDPQLSRSTASLAAKLARARLDPGKRTPDMAMKEMGQTSQAPHTTLLTLSGKQGDFLDTSCPIISTLTFSLPLDSNKQQDNGDIAAPNSASNVTQISSADNQIPTEDSRHESRSVSSTPGIVEHASALGSHQDDQSERLW